jgi:hypothetical protein
MDVTCRNGARDQEYFGSRHCNCGAFWLKRLKSTRMPLQYEEKIQASRSAMARAATEAKERRKHTVDENWRNKGDGTSIPRAHGEYPEVGGVRRTSVGSPHGGNQSS